MSEKQWKSAVDGKDLSRLPEPVQSAMNRLDTYLDLRLLGKDWETVVDALLAAHAQAQKAEPVAWMVGNSDQGPFDFIRNAPKHPWNY